AYYTLLYVPIRFSSVGTTSALPDPIRKCRPKRQQEKATPFSALDQKLQSGDKNGAKLVVKRLLESELRIIGISLVIWFIASFMMGIILRPALSGIMVGGADLGFWMAQNGSIYVFIILIFVYAKVMNKLDREHGVEE